MFKTLNKIPYKEITQTYNMLKKIFVLIIANRSKAWESFLEKICVKTSTIPTKGKKISNE